jgi:hypothetical protein
MLYMSESLSKTSSSSATIRARHPSVSVAGWFDGSLANSGERLELLDRAGRIVEAAEYDDAPPWPVSPDGSATPAEAMRITSKGEVLVKGVAVASLPASCTPGSLMRATDSNDCAAGGGDGSMCICVAA